MVDVADRLRQPPGERHAAAADADQRQLFDLMVALEDFVGDAGERTGDALGVEDDWHGYLFASSQGRVKENGGDYSSVHRPLRSARNRPEPACRRLMPMEAS